MENRNAQWVHNPVFDDPSQAESILSEMPGEADYVGDVKAKVAADVDGSDSLPLLTKEQEQHQFRKMNFLKKRAAHPDAQPGDMAAARLICERLVRANLPILFKILKPYRSKEGLWQDLLSDGECALWRAVENFEYDHGNRFIAFARRVIKSKIAERLESVNRRGKIAQQVDEYVLDEHPAAADADEQLCAGPDLEPLLSKLLPREKQVVCLRHGFGQNEALTLTEVGLELGISKTRVRQLEQQAYEKLRQFTELAVC